MLVSKQIVIVVTLLIVLINNILICDSASCTSYSTSATCSANSQCTWITRSGSSYCACASTVTEDIYFVMDASGSVGTSGWSNETTFVADMVNTGITNSSRVGIVTFATSASVKYNLTSTQHPRSVVTTAVKGLAYSQGSTYTKLAINVTIRMFQKYATKGNDRILFLITDGVPNPSTKQNPCPLKPTLDNQNITVIIVGVGNDFSKSVVDCLVNDTTTQIIQASGFTSFSSIRQYTDSFLCPTTIQLTLTEVRVVTDGTYNSEFIEFYNSGSSAINLKTNPLKFSGVVSGTLNSSIKANISSGQYVVLYKTGTTPKCYECTCTENAATRCKNALYIPCDGKNCTFNTVYKSSAVSNTNWGVVIQDGSDNSVVVNVSYKSTFPSIYTGYSFELQSLSADDAVGTNWAQSCWDSGTPGQGPLAVCSSCVLAVCKSYGDKNATCSVTTCNCTEAHSYYYSGSSCYIVPNITDCSTTIAKDDGGAYVSITWDEVTTSNSYYFEVQYPYQSGTIGTATVPENEHFYIYSNDGTVTGDSTAPIVRVVVYDNTSATTLSGSKVVLGYWASCPITTQSPTNYPTPSPTVGVPVIPTCNATVSISGSVASVTIKWHSPYINYPTTPSSITQYLLYVTCNGVNATYYSSSRVYTNEFSGCSSLTRIAVVSVVNDSSGVENDSLMKKSATTCTLITPAPTAVPTHVPTKPPTLKPTSHPSKSPTLNPTYQDWVVTSCSVVIQQGSSSISVTYYETAPTDTSNPRTIILYDRDTSTASALSSNPSTVYVSASITDTNRFVVYPSFAEYPGGPTIGATCCNATCTISTLTPTRAPSGVPTSRPTNSPTYLPTTFPTGLPTGAPTPSPTYGYMEISNCSFIMARGSSSFNLSFIEPSDFTLPIEDAKYKIEWNEGSHVEFYSASKPNGSIFLTLPSPGGVDDSVYVTVYYLTSKALGSARDCYEFTPAPTLHPTQTPTTPAPTWSNANISFDPSQFTDSSSGCAYVSGPQAACTISPSSISYSLRVLRSPVTWGYNIKYEWDINATDHSYFTGFLDGVEDIGSSIDFGTFDYTFIGSTDATASYTFTINLKSCEINDTSYDPVADYQCVVREPNQVVITVDFSSNKLVSNNTIGSLPVWIWYAIAAGVLVIPILTYIGYRYYKKRKIAELLKETKDEELRDVQELDDAANFGGLGDAVTFNPLATGGTHDIATGGQYIDSQLESQKQQFETAHVDVDIITFKQDFGQVQAVKN